MGTLISNHLESLLQELLIKRKLLHIKHYKQYSHDYNLQVIISFLLALATWYGFKLIAKYIWFTCGMMVIPVIHEFRNAYGSKPAKEPRNTKLTDLSSTSSSPACCVVVRMALRGLLTVWFTSPQLLSMTWFKKNKNIFNEISATAQKFETSISFLFSFRIGRIVFNKLTMFG